MTSEGRREAAAEELRLAEEELRATEQLMQLGLLRIAAARTYFAVFHAVRARLYAEGLEPRTHGGVLHLWNIHFVRTARYDASTSRLLAKLQKFRQEADYAQAFIVDEAGAREDLEAARSLVERIRQELESA
ncbi:MAG: HEPN domain-containing protein [Thermoanaerobaculia bacterium]